MFTSPRTKDRGPIVEKDQTVRRQEDRTGQFGDECRLAVDGLGSRHRPPSASSNTMSMCCSGVCSCCQAGGAGDETGRGEARRRGRETRGADQKSMTCSRDGVADCGMAGRVQNAGRPHLGGVPSCRSTHRARRVAASASSRQTKGGASRSQDAQTAGLQRAEEGECTHWSLMYRARDDT